MGSKSSWFAKGCVVVALAAAVPSASAVPISFNLAGTESRSTIGSPENTVISLLLSPGTLIDLITWDLTLSTFDGSWLSEANVLISNSAGMGAVFEPGFGDDRSGTASYVGSVSLS